MISIAATIATKNVLLYETVQNVETKGEVNKDSNRNICKTNSTDPAQNTISGNSDTQSPRSATIATRNNYYKHLRKALENKKSKPAE